MDVLVETLSSDSMWGAILASIVIISIGYVLTKMKLFKTDWQAGLNSIVLNIATPALVFKSFMMPVTIESLQREGFIIGFSFVFFLLLLFFSEYIFAWVSKTTKQKNLSEEERKKYSDRLLMRMMWIFGSTVFFGYPILDAVFGSASIMTASNFGIAINVYLFAYAFSIMKGDRIEFKNLKQSTLKVLKSPIILITFCGVFLWALQLATPEITYKGATTTFFDIGKTAPWLFTSFNILAGLAAPLIWISIGISLSESKIKEAFKNKLAWMFVLFKQIIMPAVTLLILIGFAQIDSLNLNADTVATITLLMATPPAALIVSLAMKYQRSEKLGLHTTVVSTLAAVVAMPFWITIANLLSSLLI